MHAHTVSSSKRPDMMLIRLFFFDTEEYTQLWLCMCVPTKRCNARQSIYMYQLQVTVILNLSHVTIKSCGIFIHTPMPPMFPLQKHHTSPNFGFVYKTNSDDYRHPKLDILHKYLSTMIKKTKITYIRYGSHAVISPGMAD